VTSGGSTSDADDPSLDASALYDLPPEEFTKARNDLVKRLRGADRREAASGVARMRRPPATAWALNRVARQRPDLVAAVFDAGARLRAAMDAALAGDASRVRPARAAEREALAAVVAEAGSELDGAGHAATDAARRRMEATLRAAMVDDAVAEGLSQGVLDADHEAPGFGFGDSGPEVQVPAAAAAAPAASDQAAKEQQEAAKAKAALQEAEWRATLFERAERLAHRADELEVTAREAEATAERARAAAAEARSEAVEARAAVDELGP
jgi:hypothetical protein